MCCFAWEELSRDERCFRAMSDALSGASARGAYRQWQRILQCPPSELLEGKSQVPDLSRSRPYRKNDNRYVEHRNGALVRAWLGHDRIDTAQQTIALNKLYTRLWLYFNFFQPVMHLAHKHWDGQRVVRVHDRARTPFDRMIQAGVLPAAQTRELAALRDSCNPRRLRDELWDAVMQLYDMQPAVDGVTEDVFATLLPSRR